MARLILLCGLPASGKTTLAKHLEKTHAAVRLSPDEWLSALNLAGSDEPARARVEALQRGLALRLLETGVTVILENGFWGRSERDELRSEARELGAAVELHVLDPPIELLQQRVEQRNGELPDGTFHVDPDHIAAWSPLFERPDADELALFDPPHGRDLR